jgi:hypothetical protein
VTGAGHDEAAIRERRGRQRSRSIAIGLALGGLAVLFYLVTIVKKGVGL